MIHIWKSAGNAIATKLKLKTDIDNLKTDIDKKLEVQTVDVYNAENKQDNVMYITAENSCYLSGHQLSMPVVDNISPDVITNEYIPSVQAMVNYINSAAAVSTGTEITESAECFIRDIVYSESKSNVSWNNNELIITHNLGNQFPNVQIFVSEVDSSKYTNVNMPWYVNDGDANNVYIDCSNYTDKLITVKVTK
jgi:hypothetical protein